MLLAFGAENGHLVPTPTDDHALARAVWIDLVAPTREEEQRVERLAGIEVPTREEMREIEPSSRLYTERGARYLTAVLTVRSPKDAPKLAAVTFILHDEKLITVRYEEPEPFNLFCSRAGKGDSTGGTGDAVLGGLLDTIIDRIADILEKVGDDLDDLAHSVFSPKGATNPSYRDDMRTLGRKADFISKTRESLVSIARVLLYLTAEVEGARPEPPHFDVKTMQRDVDSLAIHADALTSKIQLLLDAVVGIVTIEQNNIIKIFAVLSVVLMPPTLVASIYGMNFRVMPELEWPWGYPAALALMVVAGALPYVFFKVKGWL